MVCKSRSEWNKFGYADRDEVRVKITKFSGVAVLFFGGRCFNAKSSMMPKRCPFHELSA